MIFAITGTNGGKVDKARPIPHMSRRAAGACRSPGKPDGQVQPRIIRDASHDRSLRGGSWQGEPHEEIRLS
ncbi:MAG: hypothetical protein EOP24_00875 [Hyphomicrobiales bacterium]|nr:MAG: hypothetical protein EOP24_00875 [Hyphomicrobiales bacterium]